MHQSCLDEFKIESKKRMEHSVDLLNKLTSSSSVNEEPVEVTVDTDSIMCPSS